MKNNKYNNYLLLRKGGDNLLVDNNNLLPYDNNSCLLPYNSFNEDKEGKNNNVTILDSNSSEEYSFSIDSCDILFTLTVNRSVYKKDLVTLIAKMAIIKESHGVNLPQLANIINILNIFLIDDSDTKENNVFIIKVKEPSEVNCIEIGVGEFIKQINSENCNFLSFNKHSLYIFKNGSYINAKNLFAKLENKNANLGRGGSQKAHALSPLDLRLSCYLMAMFNFDCKLISSLNAFDDMSKDRYLPSHFENI